MLLYQNFNILIEKLDGDVKQTIRNNFTKAHGKFDEQMCNKEKEYLIKYIGQLNANPADSISYWVKYKNQVGKLNQKYWNLITYFQK